MARAVTRCPNCGADVSQFAAGCAICGEDLVAARQKREARYDRLPEVRMPSWLSRVSGGEALLGFILIAIALFLPVIAVFIAGFIAYFAHRNDEIVQRNFALAAVALALIILMILSFAEGGYELLPWVRQDPPFPND